MLDKNITQLDLLLFLVNETIEMKKELLELRKKLKHKKIIGNEILINNIPSNRGRKKRPRFGGYKIEEINYKLDFS